jgi:hypothetical protein
MRFVPPWVHPVNIKRRACHCSPHCEPPNQFILTSSFIVLCTVCSDLWIRVTIFLEVHNQVQVYCIMYFGCLDSNLRVNFLDCMMACISHIHFISPMCCCMHNDLNFVLFSCSLSFNLDRTCVCTQYFVELISVITYSTYVYNIYI